MSQAIFCKTRYQDIGYHSYNDMWNMVAWAGYPVIYVDQIDAQSDNTYIVTPLNDEWLHGWQSPKARIIHYELEWRWDWRADVNEPPGVAEVWAADKWYAEKIGARYVPMGGDSRLNEIGSQFPTTKVFDVALLSYQTHRRQVVTKSLLDEGLRLAPIDNLWGNRRSANLMQSRLMVHVHQNDNTPGIAPLRWCLAAAHKLPLITEIVNDGGIFKPGTMMQSEYQYMAGFTNAMLKSNLLDEYAITLHELLCNEYTFAKGIESHV